MGGKVPSPLEGEGLGEGYFRTNTISEKKCETTTSKMDNVDKMVCKSFDYWCGTLQVFTTC